MSLRKVLLKVFLHGDEEATGGDRRLGVEEFRPKTVLVRCFDGNKNGIE